MATLGLRTLGLARPRHPAHLLALAALAALAACHAASPGGVFPDPRVTEAETAAREAVATEIALDVDSLPPSSIGVTPFEVNAADTTLAPLGYGLADLLMTDLARSRQLQVVDRLRLDALLREIDLVETGRVDTATAPRVGKLIGARRLVLGTLTQRSGTAVGIGARVADVASGDVRPAVSATASLDEILQAEKALALELFERLGVNLSPAERAAVEQLPTRNLAAFLAYSRGRRFEAQGRYGAAAREYQEAAQIDPDFLGAQTRLGEVRVAAGTPEAEPTTATEPTESGGGAGEAGGGSQINNAINTAVTQTNPTLPSLVGGVQQSGPGDPSFATSKVTVIINITIPP